MATLCLKQTTSHEVFFSPKAEVFVRVLKGQDAVNGTNMDNGAQYQTVSKHTFMVLQEK